MLFSRARSIRRARRLREAFEALGPTFIKLGQILSRRPDLLPRPYLQELALLQDRTIPLPFSTIEQTLKQACICNTSDAGEAHEPHPLCLHCNPLSAIFPQLDPEPIASASLAQVHAATYRGEPVVLKILKPGVLDVINADMGILWRLRRVFARLFGLGRNIDVDALFAEVHRALQAEVDLGAEALHIEKFRAHNPPESGITAPRVYWGFGRDDLLVMERIEGRPLRDLHTIPLETRRELAHRIAHNFVTQLFVHNYFHADPHPGNLVLTPEGRLYYLDFGAVGRLDPHVRCAVRRMFQAVTQEDVDGAVEALLRLGNMQPGDVRDREALDHDVELILQSYQVAAGERWTDRIIEVARTHRIALPKSVLLLAKSMVLVESVAIELDPELHVMRELEGVLGPIVAREVRDQVRKAPQLLEEYAGLVTALPELIHDWLSRNAAPPAAKR